MTPATEQHTVHLDEHRFPCKYDGPRDYARTHVDGEGDIGLLVHCGETAASIYLTPEVAESLGNTLAQAATQSRATVQEIERVRQEEAEAARRLGEMEAARQAEQARQGGNPYLVAGGSTSPTAFPQPVLADQLTGPQPIVAEIPPAPPACPVPLPPTFADVMLPTTDTTAERERAFLRASELLGPDAGVASKIAMANYLLKGAA
ncbi:hypothetical protein [Kitasatospora purpeofusca]|uniref:hypothetical protein n=1 Tax=Kitasatospora purpeofusca TaxID=67352 RepID=UPI0038703CCE|nr:hypothetical protein OIP63_06025 [Kitasatospora purpeofusca]